VAGKSAADWRDEMKISRREFLKSIPALLTGAVVATQLPGQSPRETWGLGPGQQFWNRWGNSFLEKEKIERCRKDPVYFANRYCEVKRREDLDYNWSHAPKDTLISIDNLIGKTVTVFSYGSKYTGILETGTDDPWAGDAHHVITISKGFRYRFSKSRIRYIQGDHIYLEDI
jgi:hypothetical protein